MSPQPQKAPERWQPGVASLPTTPLTAHRSLSHLPEGMPYPAQHGPPTPTRSDARREQELVDYGRMAYASARGATTSPLDCHRPLPQVESNSSPYKQKVQEVSELVSPLVTTRQPRQPSLGRLHEGGEEHTSGKRAVAVPVTVAALTPVPPRPPGSPAPTYRNATPTTPTPEEVHSREEQSSWQPSWHGLGNVAWAAPAAQEQALELGAEPEPNSHEAPERTSSQQAWETSSVDTMPEGQRRAMLRELDTLKEKATAVLAGGRGSDLGGSDPLVREARQNRKQEESEARRAHLEVNLRAREEAFQADCRVKEEEIEERRRRQEQELATREKELAGREKLVASREQELAAREKAMLNSNLEREQQILSQKQQLEQREAQLFSLQQRLQEQQEQLAVQQSRLAARESELVDRWDQLSNKREELEGRAADLEQRLSQLRDEEDKARDQRRQMEEREMRWGEATKEAQLLKHYQGRPRFSPRIGKENHELMRQLEEQQCRMHAIKRDSGSIAPPEDGCDPVHNLRETPRGTPRGEHAMEAPADMPPLNMEPVVKGGSERRTQKPLR